MRTFSILDYPTEGKLYGKYTANSPGQAASKAFTALVKRMNYDRDGEDKFIIFFIKETSGSSDGDEAVGGSSGGSSGQVYEYVGTRIKLHKPILIGSRAYLHRNIVVSHKDAFFD